MSPFRRIVVPTDFSQSSRKAIELAVELAQKLDASVTMMHAWELTPYISLGRSYAASDIITPIEQAARAELDAELGRVKGRLKECDALLRNGNAWKEIIAVAEQTHADVIVMGTHGWTGIKHALLGSIAEKVVRMSPVPVLTVRMPNAT
jgi:nucleotide-binding universal stress UspA family protein